MVVYLKDFQISKNLSCVGVKLKVNMVTQEFERILLIYGQDLLFFKKRFSLDSEDINRLLPSIIVDGLALTLNIRYMTINNTEDPYKI